MKKGILLVVLLMVAGGGFYAYKYFSGKAKNPLAGTTVKMDGYDVKYGIDGESATITDPKTGAKLMSGVNLKVPSDFPKDLPVYGNGKVSVLSLDPKYPLITVITKEDVKTVQSWFQENLPKKGWIVTLSNTIAPDAVHMEFENKDQMGSILIAKDGEDKTTSITLSSMTKEEMQKQLQPRGKQIQGENGAANTGAGN